MASTLEGALTLAFAFGFLVALLGASFTGELRLAGSSALALNFSAAVSGLGQRGLPCPPASVPLRVLGLALGANPLALLCSTTLFLGTLGFPGLAFGDGASALLGSTALVLAALGLGRLTLDDDSIALLGPPFLLTCPSLVFGLSCSDGPSLLLGDLALPLPALAEALALAFVANSLVLDARSSLSRTTPQLSSSE